MAKKDEKDNPVFKIITVGDSDVGKTAIIRRLVYNNFIPDTISTIGMNLFKYQITLKNKKDIILTILDTAGQEKFKSLGKKYFTNAHGVLFVFAHNSLESFENIESWIQMFEENKSSSLNIPKYLVGNKNDLESNVDVKLIDIFLQKYKDFRYKSTSAKKEEDNNVKELFQELGELIYEENKNNLNKKDNVIKLRKGGDKRRNDCALKKCVV